MGEGRAAFREMARPWSAGRGGDSALSHGLGAIQRRAKAAELIDSPTPDSVKRRHNKSIKSKT